MKFLTTTRNLLMSLCLLLVLIGFTFSTPVKEDKKPTPKKYYSTSVCSSASESKTILDVYFKNGWQLESITTQLIQANSFPEKSFQVYGGKFYSEYLIIVSKTQ